MAQFQVTALEEGVVRYLDEKGQNCGTVEVQVTALEEGVVRYLDDNPCLKDTVAQMRSKIQHLKRGSSDT